MLLLLLLGSIRRINEFNLCTKIILVGAINLKVLKDFTKKLYKFSLLLLHPRHTSRSIREQKLKFTFVTANIQNFILTVVVKLYKGKREDRIFIIQLVMFHVASNSLNMTFESECCNTLLVAAAVM